MEIRSFADYLRSLDDDALSVLLQTRSDLAVPLPADIASLAARATATPSLARAVERLNKFQLQVLEAASVIAEPFTDKCLIAVTDKSAKFAIQHLIDRALIFKVKAGYALPNNLRDVLGYDVAALGTPAPIEINVKELDHAPAAAKKVLDAMVWGPSRGAVADVKKPNPGLAWLLDGGFVSPINQQTVVLHRETAIYLRGNKVHRTLETTAPTIAGRLLDSPVIQRAAIANIATILRWVEEVLDFWAGQPPIALKSGGLGVRDLREISQHLGVEEECAAFVAELSYISGLLTIDHDDRILPTTQFDIWLTQPASVQWEMLVASWKITSRMSGLVKRDESKNVAALGPELDRSNAALIRNSVLAALSTLQNTAPDLASLTASVQWQLPFKRMGGVPEDFIYFIIREAEWLGLTGQGALSDYGRQILLGEPVDVIDKDLPPTVDHILIQSDNTAIAPGPLQHEIAAELDMIADIESRGAATVFRFTESSLRRGLDHGRTGEEVVAFLKKTSKTPIPQPLEYLIADIAKKHGKLRVGNTSSFIRCEDTALITQILKDKRLDALHLRRIAPEVLISSIDATDAIAVLRDANYLPAAEDANGLLLTGPRISRAQSKGRLPRIINDFEELDQDQIEKVIRSIRTGEKSSFKQSTLRNLSQSALQTLPRTTANETLEIIKNHMEKTPQKSLSIAYANNNGLVVHLIIDPISMKAGTLIAKDHASNTIATYQIARITGVAAI